MTNKQHELCVKCNRHLSVRVTTLTHPTSPAIHTTQEVSSSKVQDEKQISKGLTQSYTTFTFPGAYIVTFGLNQLTFDAFRKLKCERIHKNIDTYMALYALSLRFGLTIVINAL